jgi:hypothetical protein
MQNCEDIVAEGVKAAGKSFSDSLRPVDAFDANKGNADETGAFAR